VVLAFFLKTTRRICAKFFSGFRRKHLFITTRIKEQCTRPLMGTEQITEIKKLQMNY